MKEIVKRLLENHTVSDEVEDTEVVESTESEEEEVLEEDWRDGKFTKQDLDNYSKKTLENARAILFSLDHMSQKHPEFHMDFSKLRSRIKNLF